MRTELNQRISRVSILTVVGIYCLVCSCSGPDSGADELQQRVDELEGQVSVLSDSLSASSASNESSPDSDEVEIDSQENQPTEEVEEPYMGTWSSGSGHVLIVTSNTMSFSGDGLEIPYEDVTNISDGRTFTLEVETRPGNFCAPYLVIFFDDEEMNEMQMHGYNSYDDAFMGNNRGLEWLWYRNPE